MRMRVLELTIEGLKEQLRDFHQAVKNFTENGYRGTLREGIESLEELLRDTKNWEEDVRMQGFEPLGDLPDSKDIRPLIFLENGQVFPGRAEYDYHREKMIYWNLHSGKECVPEFWREYPKPLELMHDGDTEKG